MEHRCWKLLTDNKGFLLACFEQGELVGGLGIEAESNKALIFPLRHKDEEKYHIEIHTNNPDYLFIYPPNLLPQLQELDARGKIALFNMPKILAEKLYLLYYL